MTMRNGRRLITSVLTTLFSATAIADMPYLLPNVFDIGTRDYVTVQGSFSEEFFEPDTAMKADDYHVVSPEGMKHALSPIYTRDLTIVEAPTPSAGTYRISTGVRTGRTAKAIWLGNDWKFLGRNEAASAGTKVYDVVSITMADTYVSRGKTNVAALAPRKQGLEFVAVTHPSAIFVGESAVFELHFNAKPLSGRTIQVYRGGMRYDERKLSAEVVSDSKGRFEFKTDRPGVYVAMTRYRPQPAADATSGVSYTYSVVFEATQ
jgi:uncharacterized GH25 family protein